MLHDTPVNKDKFDAVLKRLIASKPQTEAETKAPKQRRCARRRKLRSARNSRLTSAAYTAERGRRSPLLWLYRIGPALVLGRWDWVGVFGPRQRRYRIVLLPYQGDIQ
jgi:hypothetical protein